jgi:hypothetical protein
VHRRLIGPIAALLLLALVLTLAEKRRHRAQLTAEEAQADASASVVRLRDAVVGHERAAIVVVFWRGAVWIRVVEGQPRQ